MSNNWDANPQRSSTPTAACIRSDSGPSSTSDNASPISGLLLIAPIGPSDGDRAVRARCRCSSAGHSSAASTTDSSRPPGTFMIPSSAFREVTITFLARHRSRHLRLRRPSDTALRRYRCHAEVLIDPHTHLPVLLSDRDLVRRVTRVSRMAWPPSRSSVTGVRSHVMARKKDPDADQRLRSLPATVRTVRPGEKAVHRSMTSIRTLRQCSYGSSDSRGRYASPTTSIRIARSRYVLKMPHATASGTAQAANGHEQLPSAPNFTKGSEPDVSQRGS